MKLEQIWVWDFERSFLLQVCEHILTIKNTRILYGAAEEYSFPHRARDTEAVRKILPRVKKHMSKHNVTLDFISTANNISAHRYYSINTLKLENIFNFISWPTATMILARNNFQQHVGDYEFIENKTHPYISLNNNPGPHRNVLIDHLAKLSCVEKGLWSFRSPGEAEEYRWWKPSVMTLPEPAPEPSGIRMWKGLGPLSYKHAFCDIVCETDPTVPHYSEKTSRPLYLEIPFLIVGCQGINTQLKQYGFEIYDELWDYDFDSKKTLNTRIRLLAEQVKKVCDMTEQQRNHMYKQLIPKIKHNKEVFLNIEHHNEIPSEAWEFELYRENLLSGITYS